jgi:hypothetical protein
MQLIKVDSQFNVEWIKKYYDVEGHDIIQTSNNGYFVTGKKSDFLWAIKTDSLGVIINEQQFGQLGPSYGFGIAELENGSFVFIGKTYNKFSEISKFVLLNTYSF